MPSIACPSEPLTSPPTCWERPSPAVGRWPPPDSHWSPRPSARAVFQNCHLTSPPTCWDHHQLVPGAQDHPDGAVFQNCLPETISLTWESETNITHALNKPALLNKATKSPTDFQRIRDCLPNWLPKQQWSRPPADCLSMEPAHHIPRKGHQHQPNTGYSVPVNDEGVEICWKTYN